MRLKLWRKWFLSTRYGYDILIPLSPSTMKIERHEPGGLLGWKAAAETSATGVVYLGILWVAFHWEPLFGALFSMVTLALCMFAGEWMQLKFFVRRAPTVTIRYEPATTPLDLLARYEQALSDLKQANEELEEVAVAHGISFGSALTRATE